MNMNFNMNNDNPMENSTIVTEMQAAIFVVETFLCENYLFRRNLLSGKTEVATLPGADWHPLTPEVFNSIVRHAKKEGIGGDKSPRQNIEEYVSSDAVPNYDPIALYLNALPEWDGKNHIAELFGRIPGITSEQLSWCSTWMRSAIAHWLGMDTLHGNECVPVLIGEQGCGKSTFAVRLLPESLRMYFLDHINFGNKFDSDMALTHNLFVNIDEFANMGPSQQGKLKQTLSKVKVNGRPIFGKAQEDRRRYASFIATTNNEHPLCDPTGSRRYICIRVCKGKLIDNETPINYDQLYAQIVYELRHEHTPYWFTNDQVARIQQANLPFFRSDDLESMLRLCFRIPAEGEEGIWLPCAEIFKELQMRFPTLASGNSTKIRIGQTLKYLGCKNKHTERGQAYRLVQLRAA